MKISDRIHGTFDIKEQVLVDLINSRAVQRLGGIAQYGPPDRYYPFKGFSRLEHALGTMLLLRKVGASLETQIAGLLHDISIYAFSHLAEWVFGDQKNEQLSESNPEFVERTDIPRILKRKGISLERVIDPKKHPLLELEKPEVCADRVDYSLRDQMAMPRYITMSLEGLKVHEGRLVFSSKIAAKVFGLNFINCQQYHWGHPKTNIVWYLFAKAMALGLEDGTIIREDFLQTDAYVLERLDASTNPEVSRLLGALPHSFRYELIENGPERIDKKFRYVDPKYIGGDGKIHVLSETDTSYKAELEQQRKTNEKGIKFNYKIKSLALLPDVQKTSL